MRGRFSYLDTMFQRKNYWNDRWKAARTKTSRAKL